MSSLKINFHKTEVIVVGASKEDSTRIANCLNCKEGELPMKYLRIPVTTDKLYTVDLVAWVPCQITQYECIFCLRKYTTRWTRPGLTSTGIQEKEEISHDEVG
jgi:hypothetical protein